MAEKFEQLLSGGLVNDSEPSLQPANSARDCNNMRITSKGFNSYSAETINGTLKLVNLNPDYFVLGWWSLRDKVIVLSTRDLTSGNDSNGEIGIITINPITYAGAYVPVYNHVDLSFNSRHQIEARTYDEGESLQRVYWTDNYNPPRVLNVADDRLSTYFLVGALVPGNEYMCIRGEVTQGINTYGPNASLVNGTVFTADGTEVYAANTLVIEYVNVVTLATIPPNDNGSITYDRWLPGGNLTGGAYQYTYQLYTNSGFESTFSYLTKAFHTSSGTAPSTSTVDYQRLQGVDFNANSQKGIRIQIDGIDQNFDNIRVVAVHDIAENATDVPLIIFDGAITGSTMTFDHMGNEELGELTLADLEKVVLSIKKYRTHAILKQTFFIGDVRLSDFIPFDRTGVTAESIQYLMPTDSTGRPDTTTDASSSGLQGTAYSAASTTLIQTFQYYKVKGTNLADFVEYPVGSGDLYGPGQTLGEVFQGQATFHSFTPTGSPTVVAIIHRQKYTGVYEDIEILDDYLDTKNAGVATHCKSLHRDETYRDGILFFDIFQNPQYVHWLMDWQVPSQYATTDPSTGNPLSFDPRLIEEVADDYGAGLHSAALRSLGKKYSGINFNAIATKLGCTLAELPKFIGGWSIVRAPRDKQVLAQGILAPTVIDGTNTRPTSTTDIAGDKYGAANGRRPNTYLFYAPEFLFEKFNLPSVISGDVLVIQDYYSDTHEAVPDVGTRETNVYHYYEKFYTQEGNGIFPAKGSSNVIFPDYSFQIEIGASGIAYAPSLLFENKTVTAAFTLGAERESVGSWTELLFTEYDETTTYPNGFVASDYRRCLVNFTRPKGNLYGGTSDAAKAATQYIYAGHYQSMDADFISYLQGNAGIVNDVEVFGGDTFVCVMDLGRTVTDNNVTARCSFGMIFPVESEINVSLRQGRHLSKDRTQDATQPTINSDGLSYDNPQQVEEFVYDTGASYEESFVKYVAVPLGFVPDNWFKRRVYASLVKIDGETVDSFRQFPVNNFKDLEGRNGELFNLRSKTGRLFYWQEHAFGNIAVLERTTVATTLGDPVAIGTTGTLDRFDDLNDTYGNIHQFGLCESEDQFMWFDASKREMLMANVTGESASISLIKGLREYFQEFTGEGIRNDNPVAAFGIAGGYNPALKEFLISFRGFQVGEWTPAKNNQSPVGRSVAFDVINKQFSMRSDLLPGTMLDFNNMLLVSYSGAYDEIAATTFYNFGERVNDGTTIYVCYVPFTTTGSPVSPSADSVHWKKVCDLNEIHICDRGDVAKFFGLVYDNSIQFVQNPSPKTDKVFDNQSAQASEEFFDTASYQNSHQSQVETDIQNNENYKFYNRTWYWSIPFDRTFGESMRDHYLITTLLKDNMLNSNPVASANKKVKLVCVDTVWRAIF